MSLYRNLLKVCKAMTPLERSEMLQFQVRQEFRKHRAQQDQKRIEQLKKGHFSVFYTL